MGVEGGDFRERHAEFVALAAGADFGVGVGVDIRVHAEGDGCRAALGGGKLREHGELFGALDVDLADVAVQRQGQLGLGFADAGEHDLGGGKAGFQGAVQLAAADYVGAGAFAGQHGEDGQVVVGLYRVMQGDAGHGRAKALGAGAQGAGAVDPAGGAVGGGDRRKGDVLEEDAV